MQDNKLLQNHVKKAKTITKTSTENIDEIISTIIEFEITIE